ncbi:heme A synthase [Bacillus salitolerans]|uniref:Heme A synthase n=1 Tax=Bacillus salitolerans TaxID=1437434 RepID=A0ABW4LKE1_9BACI
MYKALKGFAILTTIGMLFVLIGGALVTKTESGAGCGDSWPLCHGELIPSNITFELVIELSHRLVSGSVGILVLILSIWTWRKIGHIRETKFLSILSFSFLMLQALIGAAAVMWGQSSFVLALHFGISLISFSSVLLLTLLIFEADKKQVEKTLPLDKRMSFHIIGIIVYSYVVVYTGALVRHKNASLACPDWPLCSKSNQLGFPTQMHEWIQMGHRFLAGVLFVWILYATYLAFKYYRNHRVVQKSWMIAAILVTMQVITGALVVLTKLQFIIIPLLHALFISCLFGVLSYLVLLVTRNGQNNEYKNKIDKTAQL